MAVRPKKLKKYKKLNWNFQRGGGGGVLEKISSVGEVWIFSGITHCINLVVALIFDNKLQTMHAITVYY